MCYAGSYSYSSQSFLNVFCHLHQLSFSSLFLCAWLELLTWVPDAALLISRSTANFGPLSPAFFLDRNVMSLQFITTGVGSGCDVTLGERASAVHVLIGFQWLVRTAGQSELHERETAVVSGQENGSWQTHKQLSPPSVQCWPRQNDTEDDAFVWCFASGQQF